MSAAKVESRCDTMRKRQPRDALNFSCACGSSGDATTKAARFSMCGSKPLKPSAHKVQ
jgi:hypothetical protein